LFGWERNPLLGPRGTVRRRCLRRRRRSRRFPSNLNFNYFQTDGWSGRGGGGGGGGGGGSSPVHNIIYL